MMIEVKMKRFLEPVLNPQILGLIIERLGTPTTNFSHMAMIIHHQVWGVATSGIGGVLRLPDGWSRTVKRNELVDPKVARIGGRGHSAHIISTSPAFLIEGFLSRIMD